MLPRGDESYITYIADRQYVAEINFCQGEMDNEGI